jgi:hypothetical protein
MNLDLAQQIMAPWRRPSHMPKSMRATKQTLHWGAIIHTVHKKVFLHIDNVGQKFPNNIQRQILANGIVRLEFKIGDGGVMHIIYF